jgi:outer membrane protein assembly factor BamE (lipoprotein component of BamABCDE complex)
MSANRGLSIKEIISLTSGSCLALCFLFGLASCQTPRTKEFESVKEGMQKDQVLETTGAPSVARRWHGKDRWIYQMYDRKDENKVETREVHFEEGHATYVGAQYTPKVSAQEQDRLNEESNKAEAERLATQSSERDSYVGAVSARNGSGVHKDSQGPNLNAPLDEDDRRFRESTYGIIDKSSTSSRPNIKKQSSFEDIH